MPAANRTTIAAAWADLFAKAEQLVGSTGNGSSLKVQKIAEGETGAGAHQKPYILFQLLTARVVSVQDGDDVWECEIRIRIVTWTTQPDGATHEALAKLGLVENFLAAYPRPPGVEGFGDPKWAISYPTDPTSGRTIQLDGMRTFTVAVARGSN